LHRGGKEAFREYADMEIFFNYTGYQLLGRGSTLLQQENLGASDYVADIGVDTGRPALLDVLVDVDDGCSKYKFLYNRYLKHQEKVQRWVSECQQLVAALESKISDG
jgi:hypothetical protein